jgi:hypothetical protein
MQSMARAGSVAVMGVLDFFPRLNEERLARPLDMNKLCRTPNMELGSGTAKAD